MSRLCHLLATAAAHAAAGESTVAAKSIGPGPIKQHLVALGTATEIATEEKRWTSSFCGSRPG